MALITFPSIIGPSSLQFGLRAQTQAFTSEFTGSSQYVQLPGSRWYGSVGWQDLDGENLEELRAFLTELQGPQNTFEYGDVSRDNPRSGLSSTINIVSSGTTSSNATSMSMRRNSGPTIYGTVSLFKKGDYFHVTSSAGRELKMVVRNETITNSGTTSVQFSPGLRGSVSAGSSIIRHSPRGHFRLANNDQITWDIRPPIIASVGFSFVESF